MAISEKYLKFKWFEWVMYWNYMTQVPIIAFKPERFLCLSIDVSQAMMVKIPTADSQALLQMTYHAITKEEWENKAENEAQKQIMETVIVGLNQKQIQITLRIWESFIH